MIRSIIMEGAETIMAVTSNNSKNGRSIYISAITEGQEKDLDNKHPIEVKFLNRTHVVMLIDVICYGSIDFNNTSEDMDTLDSFNLIELDSMAGTFIYSVFDYNSATVDTKKMYPTWNIVDIMQQAYCRINKPERTVIFFMGKEKR